MKHLIPLIFLSACLGSNQYYPSENYGIALWDAEAPIALTDGVYVHLPYSGRLSRITADGETQIELEDGYVTKIVETPDPTLLIAYISRRPCEQNEEIDCDVVEHEIALIRDAAVSQILPLAPQYSELSFSTDGRMAIARIGDDATYAQSGLLNLTSIQVIQFEDNSIQTVSVGFAADNVLFTYEGDGDSKLATGALVLSQSEVAVLDLSGSTATTSVVFPLTLDPDDLVTPVGIAITPDDQHALISASDTSDLYVLDLMNHSVNLISLSATPAEMFTSEDLDQTFFVYRNSPRLEIMDHEFFDVDSIRLDQAMDHLIPAQDYTMAWGDRSQHDVYRWNHDDNTLIEYRLQSPATEMHLSPDERFAIAVTKNNSNTNYMPNGVEILDMTSKRTTPFSLTASVRGIAFTQSGETTYGLLLIHGEETLHLVQGSGAVTEIDLPASPVHIGSLADGTFYITHEHSLGMVSFYDPADNSILTTDRFALHHLSSPSPFGPTQYQY